MILTPEHKQEIDNEIAKFLQHLRTEDKEQLELIDVVDLKNFDLNFDLNMHSQQASISPK